ncbi:PAS domain S-box protein [Desulfotruncus alcoholivorax]|uniref:PAS domain S-box protein n=1 Tax=Desulfotruncus alcoholivorax TaxID=265477 RepID=UPI00041BD3AB|nr:PAS domain S-box protein [Desulfotruncus alcoholivorax]
MAGKADQKVSSINFSHRHCISILDSIEDGFFESDLQGNIIFSNLALCRILNYPREELLGLNYKRFMDETNAKRISQTFYMVLQTCKPAIFDYTIYRKDGSERIVATSVAPIMACDGSVTGFRGIVRDITKKRRTQWALINSERNLKERVNYLNLLIENMNELFYTYDNNARITFINKKSNEITGYSPEKMIGRSLLEFVPDEYKEMVWQGIRSRLDKGEPGSYETPIYHKDGSTRIIKLNTSSIVVDGNITGGMVLAEDITVRKQAEAVLQNTIKELKETQNVLREREKLSIIGQMAAGMAHEIKNPLTAVRGFAQLLAQKCNDNQVLAQYAGIIIEEVDRANKVLSDFLQLARPKPSVLARECVGDLVEETLAIVSPQAFLSNISVNYKPDQDLPQCMIDRNQIKQVLLNLCYNAIEAMPGGGVIDVEVGYLPKNNEVFINIKDTGCGIPSDQMENLGVPFFSTKATGTGLGLSISYAIVAAHKGRIEVISREGVGTLFRIFLPC